MKKKDLVDHLVSKVGGNVSKSDTTAIVEALFKTIADSIVNEGSFQLIGFGSFKVREVDAHDGRNPRTGEKLHIPKTRRISFNPSQTLKEAANASIVEEEVKSVKAEKAPKAKAEKADKAEKKTSKKSKK